MAITTGKTGSVYTGDNISPFTTEATSESGSTQIYQIDDVTLRVWDPNVSITISTGTLDKTYFDGGINWFEGKFKLTATGLTPTVSGSSMTIQQVGKVYGFTTNMAIDAGEVTEVGDDWKQNVALGKSASVTLNRYRIDTLFDLDDSGYQECGLSGKTSSTATGLATTTQYYFKVNVDGGGEVEYDITTGSDVTYDAVIALMNTAIVAANTNIDLVNGDLRCTSDTDGPTSTIALAVGTTGTDLFVTLTGYTAFDNAVVGSLNTKYLLLKLYEDADSGYWVKAIRGAMGITKSIGSVDDNPLTFEVSANVYYFS